MSQSPAAGTLVGLGTHSISVMATDEAGNSASCTATFTVTNSTVPTVICSAVPGANVDGNCQAAVPNVLSGVTASGNCGGTNSITLSQSPAPGTLVGLGTHTITVTATDAAGNSATCTTTFTVTDNKAPTVICSATQPASADDNCQAPVPNVMGGASVSDNCSAPSAITLSQSPAPGTLVGPGSHTITANTAGGSSSLTFTLDRSLVTPSIGLAHDTGTSASDNVTSDATLTGTTDAGAAVGVYDLTG